MKNSSLVRYKPQFAPIGMEFLTGIKVSSERLSPYPGDPSSLYAIFWSNGSRTEVEEYKLLEVVNESR